MKAEETVKVIIGLCEALSFPPVLLVISKRFFFELYVSSR